MNLTHRNRVDHFATAPRNSLPLRSPLSSGEGLLSYPFVRSHTRQMHIKSPLRWRGGTAAEIETSGTSFNDAVAVGEIHPTDAL